jgi:polyhydroxyalkanoate synthesis regulator phasin
MRELIIPEAVEAEEKISGFVPVLARVIAALAMANGPITILEYTCCIKTANKIADSIKDPALSEADGPALLSAIVMRALASGKSDLDGALRDLKAAAKSMPDDVRRAALEITAPIAALQGNQAQDLYRSVANALRTQEDQRVLSEFVPPKDRSLLDIIKGFIKRRDEKLESVLAVAFAYGHAGLVKEISDTLAEGGAKNVEKARRMCQDLEEQIGKDADELFKQRESLSLRREFAVQVSDAVSANVQQVKQRLGALERWVDLQKREFAEDVEDFITGALQEIELGLRDRMQGHSWLKESAWKTFAKNQHGRALQTRYDKLRWRHERRVELLERELMLFHNELIASRPRLLRDIARKEFVGLVLPQSSKMRLMGSIDHIASFTLLTTGLAGAGSVAVAISGLATLPAHIVFPLSAAILGPMAIASLYKVFTNPEERKQKEIHSKMEEIEEGLRNVIEGAKERNAEALETIVNDFYRVAEWYLIPLVHSSRRAHDIVGLQERLIEESVRNTVGSLDCLRLL